MCFTQLQGLCYDTKALTGCNCLYCTCVVLDNKHGWEQSVELNKCTTKTQPDSTVFFFL